MSELRGALTEYLSLRRSLGFKLRRQEKLLYQFIDFFASIGAPTITVQHALTWACQPMNVGNNWWSYRLSAVRGFTNYLHAVDHAVEVPPSDLLPWRSHRASPYLYSDEEIMALIKAAGTLSSPLRVTTYQTLIGLLAVTGMRVGEAINLNRQDFDARNGTLIVRDSKFGKTRELPLHPTTTALLKRYLASRNRGPYAGRAAALFISPTGGRLLYCNIQWTFHRLVRLAGIVPRTSHCRPRIHDLRHAFAVRTLLDAYRDGSDTQQRLTLLSTYLGHANPATTYWYLSAAPELLIKAAERLEYPRGEQA
ncbi:tyrosine-type recombinase/integrase [Paraburkholderia tuberum]|uniref:Site-specific recombinase XerD n=1 Tax=Paraburkholderia tuberum TaxID=157910 RepID=A0A1H1K1P6_9BURK|nr:tyrosine-type recombinase/integrase [Paraburkholderia tuberum]SDR55859.1 Site-specific recombinase XerD [Paraburkholderia tuberum]